jgi:uncharacterized membrane protein YjgN (DUF898 family)
MDSDQAVVPSASVTGTPSVRFTGSGDTYFRIWVTNIFLTIVTLGIYSAWATVRTRKYFYQHTQLFGQGFDFHARPTQILKSRLIALVIYVAYTLISKTSPLIAGILLLGFYVSLPALVLLSLRFRLSQTSYRGIRFSFAGKFGEAYITYLLIPIAVLLSLGLAMPYLSYRANRYWLSGIRYGKEGFSVNLSAGEFFLIYVKLLGLLALGAAVMAGLAAVVSADMALLLSLLPLALVLSIWLVARSYLNARILNHLYGSARMGSVSFRGALTFRGLLWLATSNFLLIIFSFGLLVPLTRVRKARYLADRVTATSDKPFDEFIADVQQRTAATGDEIANLFDIDVPAIG